MKRWLTISLVVLALGLIAARAIKGSCINTSLLIDVSEGTQFTTRSIAVDGHSRMQVHFPSAWTTADLEVYCTTVTQDPAAPTTGDFAQLYTIDGTAVEIDQAAVQLSGVMAFTGPAAEALKTCTDMILHSENAQAADRTLKLSLTSH